jgi:hypothetical protein
MLKPAVSKAKNTPLNLCEPSAPAAFGLLPDFECDFGFDYRPNSTDFGGFSETDFFPFG